MSKKVLIIDASLFTPEGDLCDSRLMAEAFHRGWRRFIVFALKGSVSMAADSARIQVVCALIFMAVPVIT